MIEVQEWLAEIKAVKQQLAEAERERDVANESAANWRQLYTTEAQQRRTQTQQLQEEIETLKAKIGQIQDSPLSTPSSSALEEVIEQELSQLHSLEELQAKLIQLLQERANLLEELKTEQAQHAQTRKSLTTVIADTIDRITKERGTKK